jgi:hypothetical protein
MPRRLGGFGKAVLVYDRNTYEMMSYGDVLTRVCSTISLETLDEQKKNVLCVILFED